MKNHSPHEWLKTDLGGELLNVVHGGLLDDCSDTVFRDWSGIGCRSTGIRGFFGAEFFDKNLEYLYEIDCLYDCVRRIRTLLVPMQAISFTATLVPQLLRPDSSPLMGIQLGILAGTLVIVFIVLILIVTTTFSSIITRPPLTIKHNRIPSALQSRKMTQKDIEEERQKFIYWFQSGAVHKARNRLRYFVISVIGLTTLGTFGVSLCNQYVAIWFGQSSSTVVNLYNLVWWFCLKVFVAYLVFARLSYLCKLSITVNCILHCIITLVVDAPGWLDVITHLAMFCAVLIFAIIVKEYADRQDTIERLEANRAQQLLKQSMADAANMMGVVLWEWDPRLPPIAGLSTSDAWSMPNVSSLNPSSPVGASISNHMNGSFNTLTGKNASLNNNINNNNINNSINNGNIGGGSLLPMKNYSSDSSTTLQSSYKEALQNNNNINSTSLNRNTFQNDSYNTIASRNTQSIPFTGQKDDKVISLNPSIQQSESNTSMAPLNVYHSSTPSMSTIQHLPVSATTSGVSNVGLLQVNSGKNELPRVDMLSSYAGQQSEIAASTRRGRIHQVGSSHLPALRSLETMEKSSDKEINQTQLISTLASLKSSQAQTNGILKDEAIHNIDSVNNMAQNNNENVLLRQNLSQNQYYDNEEGNITRKPLFKDNEKHISHFNKTREGSNLLPPSMSSNFHINNESKSINMSNNNITNIQNATPISQNQPFPHNLNINVSRFSHNNTNTNNKTMMESKTPITPNHLPKTNRFETPLFPVSPLVSLSSVASSTNHQVDVDASIFLSSPFHSPPSHLLAKDSINKNEPSIFQPPSRAPFFKPVSSLPPPYVSMSPTFAPMFASPLPPTRPPPLPTINQLNPHAFLQTSPEIPSTSKHANNHHVTSLLDNNNMSPPPPPKRPPPVLNINLPPDSLLQPVPLHANHHHQQLMASNQSLRSSIADSVSVLSTAYQGFQYYNNLPTSPLSMNYINTEHQKLVTESPLHFDDINMDRSPLFNGYNVYESSPSANGSMSVADDEENSQIHFLQQVDPAPQPASFIPDMEFCSNFIKNRANNLNSIGLYNELVANDVEEEFIPPPPLRPSNPQQQNESVLVADPTHTMARPRTIGRSTNFAPDSNSIIEEGDEDYENEEFEDYDSISHQPTATPTGILPGPRLPKPPFLANIIADEQRRNPKSRFFAEGILSSQPTSIMNGEKNNKNQLMKENITSNSFGGDFSSPNQHKNNIHSTYANIANRNSNQMMHDEKHSLGSNELGSFKLGNNSSSLFLREKNRNNPSNLDASTAEGTELEEANSAARMKVLPYGIVSGPVVIGGLNEGIATPSLTSDLPSLNNAYQNNQRTKNFAANSLETQVETGEILITSPAKALGNTYNPNHAATSNSSGNPAVVQSAPNASESKSKNQSQVASRAIEWLKHVFFGPPPLPPCELLNQSEQVPLSFRGFFTSSIPEPFRSAAETAITNSWLAGQVWDAVLPLKSQSGGIKWVRCGVRRSLAAVNLLPLHAANFKSTDGSQLHLDRCSQLFSTRYSLRGFIENVTSLKERDASLLGEIKYLKRLVDFTFRATVSIDLRSQTLRNPSPILNLLTEIPLEGKPIDALFARQDVQRVKAAIRRVEDSFKASSASSNNTNSNNNNVNNQNSNNNNDPENIFNSEPTTTNNNNNNNANQNNSGNSNTASRVVFSLEKCKIRCSKGSFSFLLNKQGSSNESDHQERSHSSEGDSNSNPWNSSLLQLPPQLQHLLTGSPTGSNSRSRSLLATSGNTSTRGVGSRQRAFHEPRIEGRVLLVLDPESKGSLFVGFKTLVISTGGETPSKRLTLTKTIQLDG